MKLAFKKNNKADSCVRKLTVRCNSIRTPFCSAFLPMQWEDATQCICSMCGREINIFRCASNYKSMTKYRQRYSTDCGTTACLSSGWLFVGVHVHGNNIDKMVSRAYGECSESEKSDTIFQNQQLHRGYCFAETHMTMK